MTGGVRFAVADTGVGIPAEHLPRVFERFFRVPGQPASTGAGLGLAIARDIVRGHGGDMDVSQRRRPGHPVHVHAADRHQRGEVMTRPDPNRPASVLVTDDQSNIRLMVRSALETDGYAVTEAADGRAALEAVRRDAAGPDDPGPEHARAGRHGRAGADEGPSPAAGRGWSC